MSGFIACPARCRVAMFLGVSGWGVYGVTTPCPLYSSLRQLASARPSTDCGQVSSRSPAIGLRRRPFRLDVRHVVFTHFHVSFTHGYSLSFYVHRLFLIRLFLFNFLPLTPFPLRHSARGHARLMSCPTFRTGERMDVPFFAFVTGYAK